MTQGEVLALCVDRRLDFAAWRLPGVRTRRVAIQTRARDGADRGLDYLVAQTGFVVAPFLPDGSVERFVIRPDLLVDEETSEAQTALLLKLARPPLTLRPSSVHFARLGLAARGRDIGKAEYLAQVGSLKAAIRDGQIEKIVLSRTKTIRGRYRSRLVSIFDLLCDSYPEAFVSLFQRGEECWIGASPETLLRSQGDRLITVALAGTASLADGPFDPEAWGPKEREEQGCVTRQIERILLDQGVGDYTKLGPSVRRAGSLLHLSTEFSLPEASLRGRLDDFVRALHPTSAVSGLPRAEALGLLASHETHDRGYYAGYLGPLGPDGQGGQGGIEGQGGQLQLFVNLRCMRVEPDRLTIFVGGGLTADSVAEEEWKETELKAETLLSILARLKES